MSASQTTPTSPSASATDEPDNDLMLRRTRLIPSSVTESIDSIETWMARMEYGILLFGAVLTVGVVAEIWSHAIIWAIAVAIGVAGEVTLGILHAVSAAKLRVLTGREQRAQELEIARLMSKLAPRMISPEGRGALTKKLLPFKGQPVQIVVFNPGASREIDGFATNLWGTLSLGPVWEASLNPEGESPEIRRPVSGVSIEVAWPTDVLAAATALRKALNADGIEASVTPWLRGDELAPLLSSGPSDGEPLTRTDLIRVCIYGKY